MRRAEFNDLADFLMSLAQIGISIAQAVVVKSGRPIRQQRHEEQHGREHPSPYPKAGPRLGNGAGIAERYGNRRFTEYCFRNAAHRRMYPGMLQCTNLRSSSSVARRND